MKEAPNCVTKSCSLTLQAYKSLLCFASAANLLHTGNYSCTITAFRYSIAKWSQMDFVAEELNDSSCAAVLIAARNDSSCLQLLTVAMELCPHLAPLYLTQQRLKLKVKNNN